jgi:hypothetical protein
MFNNSLLITKVALITPDRKGRGGFLVLSWQIIQAGRVILIRITGWAEGSAPLY